MAKRGIVVEGVSDLVRSGEIFRDAAGLRQLRGILLDGAEIIADGVRAAVPVRTGTMRAAVVSQIARRESVAAAFVAFRIGAKKRDRYPYIVEAGSRRHAIVARRGALHFGGSFARGVDHPGARGLRTFAKGLRRSGPRAVAEMSARAIDMAGAAAAKAGWA